MLRPCLGISARCHAFELHIRRGMLKHGCRTIESLAMSSELWVFNNVFKVFILGSVCLADLSHAEITNDKVLGVLQKTGVSRADTAYDVGSWGNWLRWGDQGDGTYRNPVLPGDFSDPDCIRVGSDYYAISSTMHFAPGMVVLHSKDLVNWRIIGHVVSDLREIGPELNWDRMNRYGRGVWAGAIRHHDGRFWVYFGTPDEGYFMTTATNPAGPWAPLHRMMASAGWDDCCPFWDDDGQGYFVGTHFADGYKTYLFKLTPDGRDLIPESRVLINEGNRREANKLYKINGWYYYIFSEFQPGRGRYLMIQRARKITGPYTEVKQLMHPQREANEPNQGALVQTEAGDWYFLTHHGTGAWEGRALSLLPVTWNDNWPVIGELGPDGLGRMVWASRKLVSGTPIVTPQTSDEFDAPCLGPQWEWNHQPRADMWSLTERPGWLRLRAFKPLEPDNMLKAGNTLTQRCYRTATNRVVVRLDISGMADGQRAGLCHFARGYSALSVHQSGETRTLEFWLNGRVTSGPAITNNVIYLQSTWGLDGRCQYAYSLDGITFTTFGDWYQFDWGYYRGTRVGLYCYNNKGESGYVDLDWFRYDYAGPEIRTLATHP